MVLHVRENIIDISSIDDNILKEGPNLLFPWGRVVCCSREKSPRLSLCPAFPAQVVMVTEVPELTSVDPALRQRQLKWVLCLRQAFFPRTLSQRPETDARAGEAVAEGRETFSLLKQMETFFCLGWERLLFNFQPGLQCHHLCSWLLFLCYCRLISPNPYVPLIHALCLISISMRMTDILTYLDVSILERVFQYEFKLQYPVPNNWVFCFHLNLSCMAIGHLTTCC